MQTAFEAAQRAAAAVAEAAEAAARADRLGDAAALFELAARQVLLFLCLSDMALMMPWVLLHKAS